MKTKSIFQIALIGLATVSLSLTSCNKQVKELLNDDDNTADSEQAEFVEQDADNMSDAITKGQDGAFRLSAADAANNTYDAFGTGCAIITNDSIPAGTGTVNFTVDFGAGCQGKDGRIRKGKMKVARSGNHWSTGSIKKVTFDNFYVGDKKIEGTRTVTYNGNLSWTITADMKITNASGKTHTWISTRTRKMIAGSATPRIITDDIYEITGTMSGTNHKGEAFSAEITSPLTKDMSCQWISKGIIVYKSAKKEDKSIDFGTGTCDDDATVTVKNKTKVIKLKR